MAEEPSERAQEWQRHIARYLRGALSRREYCERHGLKTTTFDYWRRRLRPNASAVPAPTVQVVRVDVEPGSSAPAAALEVVLRNGRCVRVANDFDPRALAQVVTTLERLS
jgi:hypothetical protein